MNEYAGVIGVLVGLVLGAWAGAMSGWCAGWDSACDAMRELMEGFIDSDTLSVGLIKEIIDNLKEGAADDQ